MTTSGASGSGTSRPRGLDLLAQLNLAGPCDFLLQVENELEVFVLGGQKSQLLFPPIARAYEELLVVTARRFGLQAAPDCDDGRQHRRRFVVTTVKQKLGDSSGTEHNPVGLPLFSYADFLQVQQPARPATELELGPEPGTAVSTPHVKRLRLRLWALRRSRLGASLSATGSVQFPFVGPEVVPDGAAEEVAAVQAAIHEELTLRAAGGSTAPTPSASVGSGGFGDSKEEDDVLLVSVSETVRDEWRPKAQQTRKRGRGFGDSKEEDVALVSVAETVRHCYDRFGPKTAGRVYLRDDFTRAPWPTVKLRRLPNPTPPVVWRPEWRVGPDDGDMAERGAAGGIISWAVESTAFTLGEGFEVSLRSGDTDEERSEDDFVLTFRRGMGTWHFMAGRRGRTIGGVEKAIVDVPGRNSRHMFWCACTESRAEAGKHYVIVGTVPGLLVEHFCAARVARDAHLSHAGFSYLPEPSQAVFGTSSSCSQERPALLIESITVYPHGLTGELPFISLCFVEQREQRENREHAEGPEVLVQAALTGVEARAGLGLELAVLRKAFPAAQADYSSWCIAARRECGLPLPEQDDAEALAKKLERRARRRVETQPMAPNALQAPASWMPCAVEEPTLGPFDDTLRHDPSSWDSACQRDIKCEP